MIPLSLDNRTADEVHLIKVVATAAHISRCTPTVDLIVACDLARALSLELTPNRDEGGYEILPDSELIAALKTCIAYYLPERDAASLISLAETQPNLFLNK